MRLRRSPTLLALSLATVAVAQTPGTLDATFGSGGTVTVPGGYYKAIVQPDGRIVAIGSESLSGGNRRWVIQRYLDSGAPDASFGSAGTVTLFGTSSDDEAFDVALDGSGRIVVVGASQHSTHHDLTVARLLGSGALDTTFGTGGVKQVHVASKPKNWSGGRSVAIQADGKILVGGYVVERHYDLCLVRLTSTGAMDNTFGSGGKKIDALSPELDWPMPGAIALQADGKILIGARAYWASSQQFDHGWYVMRYQTNGALDPTWGAGGRVHGVFTGFTHGWIWGIALDPSGKVVAGGRVNAIAGSSGWDCLVARYNSNGSLDASFGGSGFVNSGLLGDDQGYGGVAVQADGRIVQGLGIDSNGATLRYLPTGALDPSYGVGGLSQQTPGVFARSTVLDGQGRVLMAGVANGTVLVRWIGGQ